jgi:hypothetical protein
MECLYRYRAIDDYTQDILCKNRLYFTGPIELNDPFDCQLPLDFSASSAELERIICDGARAEGVRRKDALRQIRTVKPHKNPEYQARLREAAQQERGNSSLCCFSAIGDSILMFSHYADRHRGVCLAFSADSKLRLGQPLPVIYSDSYPKLRYAQIRSRGGTLAESLFLTKCSAWKYEAEWRIVRHDTPAGLVSFLPSDLAGIIFGCRTSDADIEKVKGWVTEGEVKPLFYRAAVNPKKFKLDLTPVCWKLAPSQDSSDRCFSKAENG